MGRKKSASKNKSLIYIAILLAAGLFFGRMSSKVEVIVKWFVWILLIGLAALALLALLGYLKRDKALAALNDCDAQKAITINEKEIEKLKGKTLSEKQEFRLNVRLNNLAVAYHSIGDIPKAIEVLEQVSAGPDTKRHSIYVVTHHNLAYYNLELGREEAYEEECLLLRDFLAELPADAVEQYSGIFPHLEAKKQMLAGEYKACVKYYEKSVEEEDPARQTLISRVVTRFELGMIYKGLDKKEKAIEQLEFVAEHGKEMNFAKQAREMLEELK